MRTLFVRLGDAIGIGSFGLFVLAALWILYLWITAMAGWMGWPGLLLGIASAPCAVTFPFVYWYVEGAFPAAEFAVWALSLCGIAISMAWKALRPR